MLLLAELAGEWDRKLHDLLLDQFITHDQGISIWDQEGYIHVWFRVMYKACLIPIPVEDIANIFYVN